MLLRNIDNYTQRFARKNNIESDSLHNSQNLKFLEKSYM